MRKECVRRSSSEIGIVDRVNDLGAMAWAVAPELFCEEMFVDMDKEWSNEKVNST